MLSALDSLSNLIDPSEREDKPDTTDFVLHLFWSKGISLEQFIELPIPYIFSILRVAMYKHKEEQKRIEEAKNKK